MAGEEAAEPVSLTWPLAMEKLRISKCKDSPRGWVCPDKLLFSGVFHICTYCTATSSAAPSGQ